MKPILFKVFSSSRFLPHCRFSILMSLSLLLFLTTSAFSESLYSVSRKIPNRPAGAKPEASPLLKQLLQEQAEKSTPVTSSSAVPGASGSMQTARISSKSSPEKNAAVIPVSYTPKPLDSKAPSKFTSKKTSTKPVNIPSQSRQPNGDPSARSTAKGKEKPVVHFPINGSTVPEPSQKSKRAVAQIKQNKKIDSVSHLTAHATPLKATIKTLPRRQAHTEAISHYNRGVLYAQESQLNSAASEYQQALLLDPDFADAHVGLSTTAMRQNDWETVITQAKKALRQKTSFMEPSQISQAHYNLSTAYCRLTIHLKPSSILNRQNPPDIQIPNACKPT